MDGSFTKSLFLSFCDIGVVFNLLSLLRWVKLGPGFSRERHIYGRSKPSEGEIENGP
jgi:hypothetical protein